MNPEAARVAPHVWGRGGNAEQPGAIIYVGRKNIFVPLHDLPDMIEALSTIADHSATT